MTAGADVLQFPQRADDLGEPLPTFDGEQVGRFAALFTPPGCPVSLVGEFATGAVATEFVTLENVVTAALAMHDRGCTSLWQRLCALATPPTAGRGKASASAWFPGVWLDIDLGTEGHRFDPVKHGGRTLPQIVDQAMNLVAALGWGEPTAVVHTGGGVHVYFLLETWLAITDDNRAEVAALSDLAQQVFGWVCAAVGFHYGNVGNLDRPMRVAGSVNRKRNRTRPAAVQFLQEDGPRHGWAELRGLVDRAADQFRPTPAPVVSVAPVPTTEASAAQQFLATGGHVGGSLNILQRFGDLEDADYALLPPLGFTEAGRDGQARVWTRDGDPASRRSLSYGYAGSRTFVVYSDAVGTPTLEGLSAGQMLAHLRFGGDEQAAARALAAIARSVPGADDLALPSHYRAALREHWDRWQAASSSVTSAGPVGGVPLPGGGPLQWDTVGQSAGTSGVPSERARLTALELQRMRAQRDARDQLRAEDEQAAGVSPEVWGRETGTLIQLATLPAEPPARIAGLLPAMGRATLIAPRKSGKTTFMLNLVKALTTGEPFLGRFPVRPLEPGQRVGFLNFEVGSRQLMRWGEDQGIDPDRLWVSNLRGLPNPLGPASGRDWLVGQLQENSCAVLIMDTFGRGFTGESQDSNSEVTRFLAGVIEPLLADAKVQEFLLTVHTGWGGERSRGASALEDWPDALWRLIVPGAKEGKDGELVEDSGQRFFKAEGRDVDVPEDALQYDTATRTLTLAGTGNRRTARENRRSSELLEELLPLIRASPGIGVRALEQAYRATLEGDRGLSSGAVGKALGHGLSAGRLSVSLGLNGRKHYSVIRL